MTQHTHRHVERTLNTPGGAAGTKQSSADERLEEEQCEMEPRMRVWEESVTGLPKTARSTVCTRDLACDKWQEWVLSLVFAVPAAAALISRCVLVPPLLGQ